MHEVDGEFVEYYELSGESLEMEDIALTYMKVGEFDAIVLVYD